MAFQSYAMVRQRFIEYWAANEAADNQAAGYEVVISQPAVGAGESFWACIGCYHLSPEENQGKHNLYLEAMDENNERVFGTAFKWGWEGQGPGEPSPDMIDDKPPHELANLVIWANQQGADLVAVYPVEGSLWEDHPLVLLETPDLTGTQRQVFAQMISHLRADAAQQTVLAAGYRPADPSIPLDAPGSPLTPTNGIDPTQPQTALQIPGGSVVQVVRDVWWYTKRHTNVVLVVDTSGSMEGDKIRNVKEALSAFVEQIKGTEEAVGLVEFYSYVDVLVPLQKLAVNREDLLRAIDSLVADGDTALLDAVYESYVALQEIGDSERINAIVVMTDGRENYSNISLGRLADYMRRGNETGVPVVVFAIAYGRDADYGTLRVLAEATDGQVYEGTLETIRQLYKILSTYF